MPFNIYRHYRREPNRRSEVAYNRAFNRFAVFGEHRRALANMLFRGARDTIIRICLEEHS